MSEKAENRDRGFLFPNKNKKGEKSPDYSGKIEIGGVVYYASAWVDKTKDEQSYLSVSLRKVED